MSDSMQLQLWHFAGFIQLIVAILFFLKIVFKKKSPENAVSISANFRIHLVLLKWFNLVFCSPDANGSYHALASQG